MAFQPIKHLQIGIPACDELAWLPETLTSLANQTDTDFEVWVCLNQARGLEDSPAGAQVALANGATLTMLAKMRSDLPFPLHVLDATGRNRPAPEEAGVGWARKTLFETVLQQRGERILGISLDADTLMDSHYLQSLRQSFAECPSAVGCAVPYYHHVPDDPQQALQLLRYEIYLRYYHLNLWRMGSPHAVTALGSALAFRGDAYLKVKGFPPRQAGEDFYLLQRLLKMGPVLPWLPARVYPASRYSRRVPFGTGILLEPGGMAVMESRFPFYDLEHFDRIGQTIAMWPAWYHRPHPLPIQDFLDQKMGGTEPWLRMRRNARCPQDFLRACHQRLDGLKLLQCLRFYQERTCGSQDSWAQVGRLLEREGVVVEMPALACSELPRLDQVRQCLVALESGYQQRKYQVLRAG